MQDRHGDAPDRGTLQPDRIEAGADDEADRDVDQKHDGEIALVLQVDAVEDAQRHFSPGQRPADGAQELAPEEIARRQQKECQEQRRCELPERDCDVAGTDQQHRAEIHAGSGGGLLRPCGRRTRRFSELLQLGRRALHVLQRAGMVLLRMRERNAQSLYRRGDFCQHAGRVAGDAVERTRDRGAERKDHAVQPRSAAALPSRQAGSRPATMRS